MKILSAVLGFLHGFLLIVLAALMLPAVIWLFDTVYADYVRWWFPY